MTAFELSSAGAHRPYAMRYGVAAEAVLDGFDVPTGRYSGRQDKVARLRYPLGGGSTASARVPVSDEYYARMKDSGEAKVSIHYLPGASRLRPVIDEDPRALGVLFAAAVLLSGLLVTFFLVRDAVTTQRDSGESRFALK